MSISVENKIVFITGASSGIGQSCAEQFAAQGANLILTGRRFERLNELAIQLQQKYNINVLPLKLDVSQNKNVQQLVETLDESWQDIDMLINNAGVGVTTELLQIAKPEDWDTIIDTNIKGLLYVTRAILPIMIKKNSGHIVNIGSTAAHGHYAGGNVYSASKHAVKALTHSLRLDLKGYKIRVSEIDPGMTRTEFSEVRWDKARAEAFYSGFEPLQAEDVADAILYCVTRPAHVNIAEIMVYPIDHLSPSVVHREEEKD